MKDYYRILEVSENSTQDEIKKSHRKLAMKYHPNRNIHNHKAANQIIEVNEAYEILSNVSSSTRYDDNRRMNLQSTNNFQNFYSAYNKNEQHYTPEDFLAIFKSLNYSTSWWNNYDSLDIRIICESIMEVLTDKNNNYLLEFGDSNINEQIIKEVLKNSKSLGFDKHPIQSIIYLDVICSKLYLLAANNKKLINKIYLVKVKRMFIGILKTNKYIVLAAVVVIFFILYLKFSEELPPTTLKLYKR